MAVVLPMVMVSERVVFATEKVITSVVESLNATLAAVMLRLAVKLTLGTCAVLNSKPAGTFRVIVWLLAVLKSPFAPSAMIIVPRVVQLGDVALAAESAEMLVPPEAPVTVTLSVNVVCAESPEVNPVAVSCSVMFASSSVTNHVV